MNNEYAVAALNDYRPWRYPSRGELPGTEALYEVTCFHEYEDGARDTAYWIEHHYWRDKQWQILVGVDEWSGGSRVYAWRELPEPAPVIEEIEDK